MTERELNDKKKEYLLEYKRIHRKIQSLENQRRSLVETMRSAKAIEYSDMPHGSKLSDLSDYIVKLDRLIAEIEKYEKKLRIKRLDIERSIVSLDNGVESDVLRKHYIELKSFETIACELSYTYRHITRIHGWALQHLKIVY